MSFNFRRVAYCLKVPIPRFQLKRNFHSERYMADVWPMYGRYIASTLPISPIYPPPPRTCSFISIELYQFKFHISQNFFFFNLVCDKTWTPIDSNVSKLILCDQSGDQSARIIRNRSTKDPRRIHESSSAHTTAVSLIDESDKVIRQKMSFWQF